MVKIYLLVVSMILFVSSCNRDSNQSDQERMCNISLVMNLENVDIEDSPLLIKGGAPNIYGVQIYSRGIDQSIYSKYAYGVFDDIAKMVLELPENYAYKIEVVMIPNAANEIAIDPVSGGFRAPLLTAGAGGGPQKVTNSFTISKVNYFGNIAKGYAALMTGESYFEHFRRPDIDRYYGVTDNFVPSFGGNNALKIELKRTVFGIRFVTENMPADHSLIVNMKYVPTIKVLDDQTYIVSMDNPSGGTDVVSDSYSESVEVVINLISNKDGAINVVYNESLIFLRKRLYTLRLKLGSDNSNTIGIVQEDHTLIDTDEIVIGK